MTPGNLLLLYATLSIIALVVLIARYRLNPFISITVVSLGLALLAGMPAPEIVPAYEQGVGKTLGHIALIVALGTMLGKLMAESGGAEPECAAFRLVTVDRHAAASTMCCAMFMISINFQSGMDFRKRLDKTPGPA